MTIRLQDSRLVEGIQGGGGLWVPGTLLLTCVFDPQISKNLYQTLSLSITKVTIILRILSIIKNKETMPGFLLPGLHLNSENDCLKEYPKG